MAEVHAAIVGVPTQATGQQRLRGVGRDVYGWQTRLARMGVAGHRIAVTSGATCTRAQVLAAVRDLAARLARDPAAHGLLVVAGHGGERQALLQAADGPVTRGDLVAVLDAVLPGRGITALVDVCPVGDPATRPVALRPIDVVLAAAAPGHPAEEVLVGDQWHGAFTWAVHQVLDRWASTGPHGALVPISPEVLHHQASLVLEGLGFGQRPTLVGPAQACAAPLGGGTATVRAPLPPGVTRQYDPGPQSFTVYELTHSGGGADDVVVTGAGFSPTGGYLASKEYWAVAPTDGDVLKKTTNGLPATVPGNVYPQLSFNPAGGKQSYTLQAGSGQALLSMTSGNNLVGYVLVDNNNSPPKLDWYMVGTLTTYFPVTSAGLVFAKVTGSIQIQAQKRP